MCKTQSVSCGVCLERAPSKRPGDAYSREEASAPGQPLCQLRGAHALCGAAPATLDNERGAERAGRAALAGTRSLAAALGRCARLLKGRRRWWWPTVCAPVWLSRPTRAPGLSPGPSGGDSGGPGRAALPVGRAEMRR